jgi:signal transduction histidine kinase
VGSWEWDVENDRIHWSEELFRIFDVKREDFDPSFKAYLARLAPHRREIIEQLITRSSQTGEDFSFENEIQTSKGTRYVFSRGRVVKDANGKTLKMMGTSQDVTERKFIESELLSARAELELRVEERTQQLELSLQREKAAKEQAENASQAKMQFLANMSHEIRTPMNSILGFTELLETENSPAKNAEYMKRIRSNGNLLMTLIDDILDLSKFEAGQIPIQKTSVPLRRLIDDSVNSFTPALKDKELKLELEYFGTFPKLALTDGKRVSQVLVNLLGNAVKFSHGGTIRVSASTLNPGTVSICVEDSGIGISPENQKNLFKPFSQGDSSVARKFGGSGLGLALSKRIAEALGGRLELLHSELGRGSAFEFEIPLVEIGEEGQIASKSPAPSPQAAPKNLRVLLAEDSPDNAFLIQHFIKPLGYQIDVVGDGIQAVEATRKNAYDLILMDIQMPGMDGLEATRRIRASGFKKPIIALTAHALPAEAERSLNAGCDRHLTKPISRTDLTNVLESFA